MIISVLWLLAFVFALPLVEPYELARLAAVGCALLATAAAFVMRMRVDRVVELPRTPVLAVAGLFWALALLSAWVSDVRYISLISFSSFSLLPLAALTALWASRAQMRGMLIGAGGVLGLLGLWVLVQYLLLPERLVYGQVRHPFANPNSYAALLAVGVVPALAGAVIVTGRAWRAALLLLAALLIVAVTIVGGRAVWLCLLAALAVFLFMRRGDFRTHKALWLTPVLAVGIGLVLSVVGGGNSLIAALGEGRPGEAALFGRWPIWQGAGAILRDHLFTGTGIGTFFLYYPEVRPLTDRYSGGFMAHNDPLQFGAEMGLGAVLLFYAFLLLAAWRMRGVKNTMAWALFAALGLLVVHSHIDFNFYVASILLLAGLGLGWWLRLSTPAEERPINIVIPWRQALGLAIIPVLAWLLTLQGLLRSEWQVNQARDYAIAGELDRFGVLINRANLTGFHMNARPFVMAAVVPLGILESQPNMPEAEKKALHQQAEDLLARAEGLNPRLVAVPYYRARLATLYRPADAPDATEWLRQALVLQPGHLPSRMMLVERLSAAGAEDEAYAVIKDGVDRPYIKHDAAPFYELAAARALQRQDMDTYQRALTAQRELENRHGRWAWSAPEFMGQGGDDIIMPARAR